ncbi:MAG TPA: Tol-Pal system beta propeller repeat protein TolB [Syntrophorhabdaceae bacterium]|nr:Tol-Pal system beta propeller repeat protein TolB [Syntrophorhabdaceae bacterium]
MKRLSLIVGMIFGICILFTTSTTNAMVYLDVFGKSYKKITIGIPPFKAEKQDKLKTDMTDLLQRDLDFSGFFIVAPPTLIDKELTDEGIEKQEIRFNNWRSIGIELVCKAKLVVNNEELTLESFLYDTFDGSLMLAKRYRSRTGEWRRMVHRLADDILQAVTGEKGINSNRIIFASGSKSRKDIYISDIDGQNIKRLTNHRSICVSPSVSPNGKYLTYTSYREGKPNLYVLDLESNREIFVDREEGMKVGTNWIGSSSTLAYSYISGRYSTIYTLDVEKRHKTSIMRSEGIYASPSFSPDGSKMVFLSDMHGTPQIFIKDIPSGSTKRLTYSGNYNSSPVFSPKGDLIAFVAKFEGSFEICTMNVDGSNQRVLTSGGINDSPHFSPCGRYIIYSSNRGGKSTINIMLFNGENKKTLKLTDAEETQPKFVP